jgi:hypothetical protein
MPHCCIATRYRHTSVLSGDLADLTESARSIDLQDAYIEALGIMADVLVLGCASCRAQAVATIHSRLGWAPDQVRQLARIWSLLRTGREERLMWWRHRSGAAQ